MVNPNTSLVAMYIIGRTESNNTWDSINYNDPITVGMMQWFGTRAAGYLHMISDKWVEFHSTIRTALENHDKDSSYWPSRFLTRDEGESMRAALRSDEGKLAQIQLWETDYARNVAELETYGFSEADRPQPMILLMSALHQSPARARTIARNYGGNSSLARIYQAIQAEPVLSRYMTHRYTPTYNYLNSWNGTDGPPDFGQVHGDYVPPGDDTDPPRPPDPPPSEDTPWSRLGIRSIQQVGDSLHLIMDDRRRIVAHPTAIQQWSGAGSDRVDPPPPDPEPPITPEPEPPAPGNWAHPCPARSRISSEWGPRGGGMHRGIDMAAPMGTPMYAVADGEVLRAGTATGFGGYIGIRLDSGIAVGYGHMKPSSHLVRTGDRVVKGQMISRVASEGQSSGPHLHFEAYSGGVLFQGHVNPRPILESNGVTP